MSGKPRRRVTVENTKQLPEGSDSKRKPSVFERLGPGAPPRNYDQPTASSSERYEKGRGGVSNCNSWMKTGTCNFGKTCRYSHPPRRDHNSEDLRHKVQRRRDTTQSEDSPDDSDSDSDRKSRERMRKHRTSRSHEKEAKMRSTVVITKKQDLPDVSESGSEQWDHSASGDERGFESELELEKRRQALQRELRTLQEAEAEENRLDNILIEREPSSSDSDSSSEDSPPPPPPKKEKRISRAPQQEEPVHRKKMPSKERRRKSRTSRSKSRPTRAVSSPEIEVPQRGRGRARRGEDHSAKQRVVSEPSSDDADDQSPEPPARPSKERRHHTVSEQQARKRSLSSSDERQKSPEERKKKLPLVGQHYKRSPERRRKTSQPPPRERQQQQHKEKERERFEREREKEREREQREREKEKELELKEREKIRVREKERHEPQRRGMAKKSPLPPPEKTRRKAVTPDISPRPEKRQRQESPEYERKPRSHKLSETPDECPPRDHSQQHDHSAREHASHVRESRRGPVEVEAKGKRPFSPRDSITPRVSKRHASPVDYKKSRSPEVKKVKTSDPPPKARRGRVEEREPRGRTQASPSGSHKSGSRHNSPDARLQSHRHVTPEGRPRREQRDGREVRDQREGRESRERRNVKEPVRDPSRDQRDVRDHRHNRDGQGVRDSRDHDKEIREREVRNQQEERGPRVGRDREARVDARPGRDREVRDRDPERESKEMRGPGREEKQVIRDLQTNDLGKRLVQLAQTSSDDVLSDPTLEARGRRRGGTQHQPEGRQRNIDTSREREPREPVRRGGRDASPEFSSQQSKPAPQGTPRRGRRGKKDTSPEPAPPARMMSPEGKRGKGRRQAAGAKNQGRAPLVSPEPVREREPRNVRDNNRERDDSRGSRERVERIERDGRGNRDMKDREPRGRDMKEGRDEHEVIERGNRSMERGMDRGMERGALERGGMERGNTDRNVDRNLERGMDRGMDRNIERNIDHNLDRGMPGMNRAPSPLMSRDVFDKSRSPTGGRRRLTPEPTRGRRMSPEDLRSQGHRSPYPEDFDNRLVHSDHMRGIPDLMEQDFDLGHGRMGRNDGFVGGHRMPDDRFDRPLERDRGDRFDLPQVDERRFRGRDQYDQQQGYRDRPLIDDDYMGPDHDNLWSPDSQWNNNRGRQQDQPMNSRRGGRGRQQGRDDGGRSRRGRGRGDRRGEESFRFDDQYLGDAPLDHDQWQMWDDQHPDNCQMDNRRGDGRRMDGRHGRRGQDRGGDLERHRMYDDMPEEQMSPYLGHPGSLLRPKRSYIDDHSLTPPLKCREMSPTGSKQGINRNHDMRGDMMPMDNMEPLDNRDMCGMRSSSRDRIGPGREHDPRDIRDLRDIRDICDVRDLRDMRDIHEERDPRDLHEPLDECEPRENWDGRDIHDLRDLGEPRDLIDPRDSREGRDLRNSREPRGTHDPKDLRDSREPRDTCESRNLREPRDMREPRDTREQSRESRDIRDGRDQREPREGREPRDGRGPKDIRDQKDNREPRIREGRPQRERGRDGSGSERGAKADDLQRDKRENRVDSDANLPPSEGKRPRSASPSPSSRSRKRQRGPPEKGSTERRGDKAWLDEPRRTPTKEGSLPPRLTDSPIDRPPGRELEDSASHGGLEKGSFSDWSDEGEIFGPHGKVEEEVDVIPVGGGTTRGPPYRDDRSQRSPSRSSIGSRHSHRDDRHSGYRSDDMRRAGPDRPSAGRPADYLSDGEHGPGEWGQGAGAGQPTHRIPSFQGEPHSPLDVASTPPWERGNRRRNRGGSETSERERERPPLPGSFGEAEAAARAADAVRNNKEVPATSPVPATTPSPTPPPPAPPTPTENPPRDRENKLYDDISDDDLDDLIENVETEVEEKKTGVSDALDIDWACLIKETQRSEQRTTNVSVLRRFTQAAVFSKIGVSRVYAGEALFNRLKHVCQKQMDNEASTDDAHGVDSEDQPPPPQFEVLNDVAALHAADMRRRRQRSTILHRIGPFRRALCARRDIVLRRYLCRLDQESDVTGIFAAPIIDQDLYRQSLQFLRQGSSERKFAALPEAEPMSV